MTAAIIDRMTLPGTDAEFWLARLDVAASRVEECARLLSSDEKRRAARFHLEYDRQRFIVARGTLRLLLGGCLERAPGAIEFQYGEKGKPAIAGVPLYFNVSHSHKHALYGFSKNRRIGVDIEYLERDIDYEGLAQRFLSSPERAALQDIPKVRRKLAFLACWTGKEAIAKATGDGLALTLGLDKIEVIPTLPPFISNRYIAGHRLYTMAINDSYVASVAIQW